MNSQTNLFYVNRVNLILYKNRTMRFIILPILVLLTTLNSYGQIDTNLSDAHMANQRDVIDYGYLLLHKNIAKRTDSSKHNPGRLYISAVPAAGYSTATGFAGILSGNVAFYSHNSLTANLSTITGYISYTAKKQLILPIQSSIWTDDNKFNFVGDYRYLNYVQGSYGLGSFSSLNNEYTLLYQYIRFYQFALRNIGHDFMAGIGYQLDYHWDIRETDLPPSGRTDIQRYGYSYNTTSSGLSADLLYDTRKNSLNAQKGVYFNAILRQNLKVLGSDSNYASLIVDLRKYITLPGSSHNVLALWSYNWFTLNGKPPYLDLPSTGWDVNNNTGRGYVQSRFRGRNMMDLEAEYRIRLTRNGFLGMVVFGNAETFGVFNTKANHIFAEISPAAGAGLRIKLNKFSGANICLDYGFGADGSRGFYVNLGEVF